MEDGMKKHSGSSERATQLRRKAEKRVRQRKIEGTEVQRAKPTDPLALIHELEVHQIELEMQNEELRRTQAEAEGSRALYAELFDFAPLGYLTLDAQGLILDVNLAGTELLGNNKVYLVQKPFMSFLAMQSRMQFGRFLSDVLKSSEKRACELHLIRGGQPSIEVHVDAIIQPRREGSESWILMALVDVTERKRVEGERERLVKALEDSLAKVRRLSGMLPICASCKRIRDDKGYWQQVEQYIKKHSEAEFSHGLCPECAARLYPDLKT